MLTPTGAALLEEVRPALDRIAGAARRHRDRRGEAPGAVLRVNALATFSLRWLLPRLSEFRARHPGNEVRLTTSNDAVDALQEPYDVIIRGGPDTFDGYSSCLFLSERRLPVCSPALVARLPLADVTDFSRHTLLHVATMPRLWNDWLRAAGATEVDQAADLIFDHFYLAVQAALDGLGVAMGPTALVADDRAAGRLVTPFPDVSLPARSYHAYLTEPPSADPAISLFCDWLQEVGRNGA